MIPEMNSKIAYMFAAGLVGPTFATKDKFINSLLWREFKGTRHEAEFKQAYLDKRREWMNYNTITQRYWQSRTSNVNKAVHHDSIAIREKYVRLTNGV